MRLIPTSIKQAPSLINDASKNSGDPMAATTISACVVNSFKSGVPL